MRKNKYIAIVCVKTTYIGERQKGMIGNNSDMFFMRHLVLGK